jgi:hypothetical protein
MKLREDDKQFLIGEIKIAVRQAVAEEIDKFNPHGISRVGKWLRDWGLAAAAIATPLTLLGMLIAVSIFAANGISKNVAFQVTTESRLKNIEEQLKIFNSNLTKQSLINHAALPLQDFKTALPELATSIANAKNENISVPPNTMDALASKLAATATSDSTPTFWQAAGAVITYRSTLLNGNLMQISVGFPPCQGTVDMLGADKHATWQAVDPKTHKPRGKRNPILRMGVQDCYIQLDGHVASKWDCTRCVIKYSGGALSLTDVKFTDCIFIFDLHSQPPKPGESLVHAVLASDSQKVEIPAT